MNTNPENSKKINKDILNLSYDIVNSIQVGLHIYHIEDLNDDRTLRMIYSNPIADQMTGLKSDDLLGMTIDENFPGLRDAGIPQTYAQIIRTGSAKALDDLVYEDSRMSRAVWSVYAFPLPENHLGVAFTNISEKKKAEKELIEEKEKVLRNEELLNKTGEIAKVGGWEINLKTNTLSWTKEVYRIHEVPDDYKPTVESAIDFYDEKSKSLISDAVSCAIETGKPFELELGIVTAKGTHKNVRALGDIKRGNDGSIEFVYGTFQDITELKHAETVLINNQRLESLGLLAGGIAHDFNNLLMGIYGYIDMAGDLIHDESIKNYIKKAMSTIDRSRDLTRQLITFAEGGEPIISIDNLFPFVKDTVCFALSGSTFSPEFNIPEDIWPGKFDKNQIGQVIDNIIINAKQASTSGSKIIVSAENCNFLEEGHNVLSAGRYVKISIKDFGSGISPELKTHIFDPFYTTKELGTGLGLSTSYSIISRHGGTIEVESEIGKGSVFHIFIPAVLEEVPSKNESKSHFVKRKGTFIVMDDQEMVVDVCRAMLESLGYSVVGFNDGKNIPSFINEKISKGEHPVGAILDLTVPGGVGGVEVAKELREMNISTPLFAASGHSKDPVLAKPFDYGFNASITKPFDRSQLAELLSTNIKSQN